MEVRLWHEFARYVSLIAAKTTEGRSLFAPAFLCDRCTDDSRQGVDVHLFYCSEAMFPAVRTVITQDK